MYKKEQLTYFAIKISWKKIFQTEFVSKLGLKHPNCMQKRIELFNKLQRFEFF